MEKEKFKEKLIVFGEEFITPEEAEEVKNELSIKLKVRIKDIIILRGVQKIEFVNVKIK